MEHGYHYGAPSEPGYYLMECQTHYGNSRSWHLLQMEMLEDEPERNPGQKQLYVFDHRGGNRFWPRDGSYVRDYGYVCGYIPFMELSGPVLAKRMYLDMLRTAWYFDQSWSNGGHPREVELAWLWVQRANRMAESAMAAELPADLPKAAMEAAQEAIDSVKFSKYTKLLGMLCEHDPDEQGDGVERPSLLPWTVRVRCSRYGGEYVTWALLFFDGRLEAARSVEDKRSSDRFELPFERSSVADFVAWLGKGNMTLDDGGEMVTLKNQIYLDGTWRDTATAEEIESLL